MKPNFGPFLAGAFLLGIAQSSEAQDYTRWGGNGHYYSVVMLASGQGWEDAKLDAEKRGGYLATLTSAEENDFVFQLTDHPEYWTLQPLQANFGPYIGFFHEQAAGPHPTGWKWVTGEPEGFTHWDTASLEPNNFGGSENYAHFHTVGTGRASYWNDLDAAYPIQPNSYVIERNSPVPEPTSMAALGFGAAWLAGRRRRSGAGRSVQRGQ